MLLPKFLLANLRAWSWRHLLCRGNRTMSFRSGPMSKRDNFAKKILQRSLRRRRLSHRLSCRRRAKAPHHRHRISGVCRQRIASRLPITRTRLTSMWASSDGWARRLSLWVLSPIWQMNQSLAARMATCRRLLIPAKLLMFPEHLTTLTMPPPPPRLLLSHPPPAPRAAPPPGVLPLRASAAAPTAALKHRPRQMPPPCPPRSPPTQRAQLQHCNLPPHLSYHPALLWRPPQPAAYLAAQSNG